MLPPSEPSKAELWPLARLFLRLGLTAFGGPAAHIARMRQEVGERRKWLTQEQFLDLDCGGAGSRWWDPSAVTPALPGPPPAPFAGGKRLSRRR